MTCWQFYQRLNPAQYQHLMNMMNTHLKAIKLDSKIGASSNKVSSTYFSISINPSFNSSRHQVVDLGATSHICYDQSIFHTLGPVENPNVTLPNHIQMSIQTIRNVKFSSDLMLNDVLYVLWFKFNLLSISALIRNSSLYVKFLTDSCMIQDLITSWMIGKGEKNVDLYIIDSSSSIYNNVCQSSYSVSNNVTSQLWHHRLGHLSFQ